MYFDIYPPKIDFSLLCPSEKLKFLTSMLVFNHLFMNNTVHCHLSQIIEFLYL